MVGNFSFCNFVVGSELMVELINDVLWFINVMLEIVVLKVNVVWLNELVVVIECVCEWDRFYVEIGVSCFQCQCCDKGLLLVLDQLLLYYCGYDVLVFLIIFDLWLYFGDWVYLNGMNGCGKSSLLKVVVGLWFYGEGWVVMQDGVWLFFVGQEFDVLDCLMLKVLVIYFDYFEQYSDILVVVVLLWVGFGGFVYCFEDDLYQGKNWCNVLLGGQKQCMVLVCVLLVKLQILLLDEVMVVLDVDVIVDFYLILCKCLFNMVIFVVLYGEIVLYDFDGEFFYFLVLEICDGVG